jgi:crotonobetainyl-CoA:carnitine CoA-transferase CaiB-like acyl-CoA transferase
VPKFSRTPGHIHRTGPDLGSDTHQVLLNLGFDEQQISTLRAAGIVMEAKAST